MSTPTQGVSVLGCVIETNMPIQTGVLRPGQASQRLVQRHISRCDCAVVLRSVHGMRGTAIPHAVCRFPQNLFCVPRSGLLYHFDIVSSLVFDCLKYRQTCWPGWVQRLLICTSDVFMQCFSSTKENADGTCSNRSEIDVSKQFLALFPC